MYFYSFSALTQSAVESQTAEYQTKHDMLLSRSALCMVLLFTPCLQQVRSASSTAVPRSLWWIHCTENRKCGHYFQTGPLHASMSSQLTLFTLNTKHRQHIPMTVVQINVKYTHHEILQGKSVQWSSCAVM